MNPNKTSAHPSISNEAETRAPSNQVRFDSDSGNVPTVVVVLLQIHGCSEERGGAAEETDGSLILHSLRYTHTHSPAFVSQDSLKLPHSPLLLLLKAVKHNNEMTSRCSHGKNPN